jgi:hypothetical protein
MLRRDDRASEHDPLRIGADELGMADGGRGRAGSAGRPAGPGEDGYGRLGPPASARRRSAAGLLRGRAEIENRPPHEHLPVSAATIVRGCSVMKNRPHASHATRSNGPTADVESTTPAVGRAVGRRRLAVARAPR